MLCKRVYVRVRVLDRVHGVILGGRRVRRGEKEEVHNASFKRFSLAACR